MGICFSWLRPVDPRSKEEKRLASESALVDACNAAERIQSALSRESYRSLRTSKGNANSMKGKPVLKY